MVHFGNSRRDCHRFRLRRGVVRVDVDAQRHRGLPKAPLMPWWLHFQAEIAGWWLEAGLLTGFLWIVFMRTFRSRGAPPPLLHNVDRRRQQ